MDGWMVRWMDGWLNGWMDELMPVDLSANKIRGDSFLSD